MKYAGVKGYNFDIEKAVLEDGLFKYLARVSHH